MMKTKKWGLVLMAAVCLVFFVGCGNPKPTEQNLVGIWADTSGSRTEFFKDGNVLWGEQMLQWRLIDGGNKLLLTHQSLSTAVDYNIKLSEKSNLLTFHEDDGSEPFASLRRIKR